MLKMIIPSMIHAWKSTTPRGSTYMMKPINCQDLRRSYAPRIFMFLSKLSLSIPVAVMIRHAIKVKSLAMIYNARWPNIVAGKPIRVRNQPNWLQC